MKIYAASTLQIAANTDATPHKMPEIVAMAESLLTSNKSSEYFMKNPDRTNNIASIM